MGVIVVSTEQVDYNVWRLEWISDLPTPTYYVYVNGTLSAVTTATSQLVTVQPGATVVIEVYDDPNTQPADQWPSNVVLSWAGLPGVAHYRVEQYVGGAWTEVDRVYPNVRESYQYRSATVADVITHQFRVVAVGVNGEESAAREWAVLVVRRPDTPELSYSYDTDTNTVTLSV